MKKFSKTTSIVLSVILGIVMIVGFLFTYIPMTFGSNTWVSFFGAQNVSSDIAGGMYGEFNIVTENATESQLISSMQMIKEVFSDDGYKNVNVYAVGNKKLRVEVSYPKGDTTYSATYSKLINVTGGAFSLRNTQSLEDSSVVLSGDAHVKYIKVYTNNDTKYISIKFNKAGEEVYKKLANTVASTGSIYLVLGDYSQSISIGSSISDYTQLTLSDDDYSNLIELSQKLELGCMSVEVDDSAYFIGTMAASLSNAQNSSAPEAKNFSTSTALIVAYVAFAVVVVAFLVLFAVKFGLYSILMLVTALFNSYLLFIIMSLVPSVEIGLSGIAAMTIGFAVIYTFAYIYVSRVKEECLAGKSLSASLDVSFKKTFASTLISNLALFVCSLLLLAFAFGEISSVAVILSISAFLSLFTNLLFVPFLIKICISFNGFGRKLFGLPKVLISDYISKEEE